MIQHITTDYIILYAFDHCTWLVYILRHHNGQNYSLKLLLSNHSLCLCEWHWLSSWGKQLTQVSSQDSITACWRCWVRAVKMCLIVNTNSLDTYDYVSYPLVEYAYTCFGISSAHKRVRFKLFINRNGNFILKTKIIMVQVVCWFLLTTTLFS